jgi:hypothetical protein
MVAQKVLKLLVYLTGLRNIRLKLTFGIFLSYIWKFCHILKLPLIHFIVVIVQIVKEFIVEIVFLITTIHREQWVISLLPLFLPHLIIR